MNIIFKKRHAAIAVLLAVAFTAGCGEKSTRIIESGEAGPGDPGYAYKLTVERMEFNWKIEGGDLRIKLKAPVRGWLAAGFNPDKGMQGAHMVIGMIENGRTVATDQHGIDSKHHKPNSELGGMTTVKNVSGSQSAGSTEIMFTTPLRSPDKLDKPIDPAAAVVMLAYGTSNELAKQHVFWGEAGINLMNGAYAVTVLEKRGK